jgi:hypothetical protein
MTAKLSWLVMVLLNATAIHAAESVRAFGLEFTVISNAVMTVDPEYPVLHVAQVGGPDCSDSGTGTNEVPNLPFGVSVHLGEAQSGVYIYPDAECRTDYRSMWGNAFGNVSGETNQLISSVRGTRQAWGHYSIEADLTPLGATSYTYQVWSHGVLTLSVTNHGSLSAVNTLDVEDYNPRVNPIFLTDAGPAVLIEFPRGTVFGVSGDGSTGGTGSMGARGVGDRMFIIAQGTTNHVNYVSRVDVFGSADLPSFAINDARIGMFGRPHKALGGVNFTASSNRLTVGPLAYAGTNEPGDGVMVDFKNGAVRWQAQTDPFALQQTNAAFLLSTFAVGSSNQLFSAYLGPVGFRTPCFEYSAVTCCQELLTHRMEVRSAHLRRPILR